MRILIILEGGLVQHVLADAPVEVRIVDYDTEGADDGDTVSISQDSGKFVEAYMADAMVDVNPARTAELFAIIS